MITEKQYKDAATVIAEYFKQPLICRPTHPSEIGCRIKLSEFGRKNISFFYHKKKGTVIDFVGGKYFNEGIVLIKWDNIKKPMPMHIHNVEPIK